MLWNERMQLLFENELKTCRVLETDSCQIGIREKDSENVFRNFFSQNSYLDVYFDQRCSWS